VLPVGGIKEKVIAAHRAGIRAVILPDKNQKDLEDIPDTVRKQVTFIPVENIGQAIEAAFDPPPGKSPKQRARKKR
jgi:ATP-dependent Lon protease